MKDNKSQEYINNFPEDKIFAPKSIWHGWDNSSQLSKESHLKIEIERMRDFIEWLFQEENIHWMTQSEAWEKFDEKEINYLLNAPEPKFD